MPQKIKFYLIVVLQIVFILGMIIYHQTALLSGRKILLKIEPIDPRDLFRGYYAHLNYEISQVFTNRIAVDKNEFKAGEYVYVTLARPADSRFYEAIALSHKRPEQDPGRLIIRGRVTRFNKQTRSKVVVETEEGKTIVYEQRWPLHLNPGDEVIIYLDKHNQVRSVLKKQKDRQPPSDRKVEFGKVVSYTEAPDNLLYLKYGIESYFVEETRAPRIERERQIFAEISLGSNGRALVSRLFLKDIPLE